MAEKFSTIVSEVLQVGFSGSVVMVITEMRLETTSTVPSRSASSGNLRLAVVDLVGAN